MKKPRREVPPKSTGERDLLFEIGVEELPARFVSDLVNPTETGVAPLCALMRKRLDGAGLPYREVGVYATPRRLVFFVEALADKGKDLVQESLGPALAQAKDAHGNWTPAAQGFARSQGLTPEQLEARETERGPRLCAVRRTEGMAAAKLLPTLLTEIIREIPFPKNMVWEQSRFPFARPIRWILALHGNLPVKFELAGVRSGKNTYGLRVHGDRPLPVSAPSRYKAFLRDHCVVVDPQERRDLIGKQIQQAVRSIHGQVHLEKDNALMDEVVYLVEHPVAILGKFDARYLQLPAEVLTTSMKKHQKFFPVYSLSSHTASKGKTSPLLPHFIGIRNGISDNQVVVREGYERVLTARLSDAVFFFEQDKKTRLEEKVPSLKQVLFQKELGSVWARTERVIQLTRYLCERLAFEEVAMQKAARIAYLAKADLVSAMVGEFPELQGVMGRIYAASDGEPAGVPEGVEQHYWPLSADGTLPKESIAAVVAVVDKIDTLAGDFLVGLIPSGSQDPYGLRRATVGILRILSDQGWSIDLSELIKMASEAFPVSVPGDREATRKALLEFFRQRWSALKEAEGFRFDEVLAVSLDRFVDIVDTEKRLKALQTARRNPNFESISTAFKRAENILTQARKKGIFSNETVLVPERLAESAEKELHAAYIQIETDLQPVLASSEYDKAFEKLVTLRPALDRFFESTMVMVPEEGIRSNRLALLNEITSLFRRLADLSCLQVGSDLKTRGHSGKA